MEKKFSKDEYKDIKKAVKLYISKHKGLGFSYSHGNYVIDGMCHGLIDVEAFYNIWVKTKK